MGALRAGARPRGTGEAQRSAWGTQGPEQGWKEGRGAVPPGGGAASPGADVRGTR